MNIRPLAALLLAITLALPALADPKPRKNERWNPSQVIVKYKAGSEPAIGKHGVKKAKKLFGQFKRKGKPQQIAAARGLDRVYLLDLDSTDVEAAVRALAKEPGVEYAEPNWRIEFPAIPNDPAYSTQWGLAKIGAPAAWDSATSGSGVVIGIVDSGVDLTHPDLAANLWTNPGEIAGNNVDDDANGFVDDVHGWDFFQNDADPTDTYGHGTHVAGIIGAVGNNATGGSGVAWTAKLAALRMGGSAGNVDAAVQALEYANMMGFRITNNSWGWSEGGQSFLLDDVIAAAEAAGNLFVVSAGNNAKDNDQLPTYPAHYANSNVITVTATTQTDGLSSYANWGATSVDLGAPGDLIDSTRPGGTYGSGSGTSFATPFVVGAAALYWTANPAATHVQVRDELLFTTDPVTALHGKSVTGGRLSLANLFDSESVAPSAVADLTVLDATFRSVTLRLTATGDDASSGNATRYDVRVSTSPLTQANFAAATQLTGEPIPLAPGTLQTFKLTGVAPATTYYVGVRVYDNAGNGSALSNVATFTTTRAAVIFDDNVEDGTRGWTAAGSDGVGGPSLWRRYKPWNRSYLWSYSKDVQYGTNYDTGARNWGTLTSPEIDLRQARDSRLRFSQDVWMELSAGYDECRVQISAEGGPWTTILTRAFTFYSWLDESLDLSAYDGQRIRIRFSIDTVDDFSNAHPGWFLDDLIVEATSTNAPPVANINGPYSVTEDASATLTSAGSSDPDGAPLLYKWSFGDGGYAYTTSTTVTHTWTRPGSYTATLVAFDGSNSSDPVTITISPAPVNDRPVAVAQIRFNAPPFNEETPIQVDWYDSSDEENTPLRCKLNFGDGSSIDQPCSPGYDHRWDRPGTYTVSLIVNDGQLDSLPSTLQVTIVEASNDKPIARPGGPYQAMQNQSVTLDGTASSDDETSIASYLWTFPDGTTSTLAQPSKVFPPGSNTVTLVVTDQTGLASLAATTQVRVCGDASVELFGGTVYGCDGGTARVGVNVKRGYLPLTLTWSDGYVQQITGPLFNGYYAERLVAATGTTTYALTSVTDGFGCAGSVGATTTQAVRASASLSGEQAVCAGAQVYLTPLLTGDRPWTLTWSDGYVQTVPTSGGTRRLITAPSQTTTYSIVSATCASCTSGSSASVSGSHTIRIITPPSATLSGGGTSCSGSYVPLNVTITGGEAPYTIYWSDGMVQDASANTSRAVSPSTATTYTITKIMSGTCEGSATGSATVTLGTYPTGAVSGGGGFCPGGSATITAALTGTAPFTIVWSDGVSQTVTTGNSASRQVSPSAGTTYSITSLTSNGCTGYSNGSAYAWPKPAPAATVSGGGTFCPGANVTISAALTGAAPFTVVWSDGVSQNIASGTTATRSVSPSATTTYTVTAVSDGNGCTVAGTGSALASRIAAPPITQQPANVTIARNAQTTLTVAASGTGLNYQWYQGATGVTTTPVGTNSSSYLTAKLRSTTQYWVMIWTGTCTAASTNSQTATVTVP